MQVILAQALGMCFGVRDALALAESAPRPDEISVFGELVHNPAVLARLTVRGMEVLAETQRHTLPMRGRVLITAHGVSESERQRLLDAGKQIIDTTCPLVRRAHAAAQRLAAESRLVVVIGRADHVEVRGIIGDLKRWMVVESLAQVRAWPAKKLGVMCQTTAAAEDAAEILAAIRRANPQADIRFVDTICQPTKDRQAALEELLKKVQAVVVVGARHSNNTRKLVDRCVQRGVRTLHVQEADELCGEWFAGLSTVGLTAGTSALPETIAAVHARLYALEEGVSSRRPLTL